MIHGFLHELGIHRLRSTIHGSRRSTDCTQLSKLRMAQYGYTSHFNPAAGAKSDFEKLLGRFTETGSVRFEEFSAIWVQMKMPLIFAGRQDDRECREFTEETMRIAVELWMPPYSFHARIGALYLLYGLHTKQLFRLKAKIRVTPPQWREAMEFLKEIQRQQHLDVEFIFTKLRRVKAFHFVSTPKQMYPQMTSDMAINDATVTSSGRVQTLMEADEVDSLSDVVKSNTFAQLSAIHWEYQKMKCALTGPEAQHPDPGVDLITADLPDVFDQLLTKFEDSKKKNRPRKRRKCKDEKASTDSEWESDEPESSAARRKNIRDKAYQTITVARRSRRHRQVELVDLDEVEASPTKRSKKRRIKNATSESETGEDTVVDHVTLPNPECAGEFLSMPSFTEEKEVKSTTSKNIKSEHAKKKPSQTKSGTGTGRFKKSANVSGTATKSGSGTGKGKQGKYLARLQKRKDRPKKKKK